MFHSPISKCYKMRNLSILRLVPIFLMMIFAYSTSLAQSNFEKDAGALINEYFQKSTHLNKTPQYFINDDVLDEASSIRHIYAQQQINGIFVKDALLGLHFSKVNGSVAPTDQFAVSMVNTSQPTLTAEKAVLGVMASLGIWSNT